MDIGLFNSGGGSLASSIDVVGAGAIAPNPLGPSGLFIATAASVTGAAIATTTAPAIYNPANSGKLVRIISVRLGDVSGTIIRANIRYYWQKIDANITITASTAGSILSRTRNVAPSASFFTAVTVSSAATIFMQSGLGSGGAVAAQFYNLRSDEEGSVTVLPGEVFYPYVSNAAIAMVADVTVMWVETPIPTGA